MRLRVSRFSSRIPFLFGALLACSPASPPPAEPTTRPALAAASGDGLVAYTEERQPCDHRTATRMALFGDLHVHTNFSFDAAANTIGATPDDAYRYGKGEPIAFWPLENGKPAGQFAIDRPLDFLAVTDHGEFLGERRMCREKGSPNYDSAFCQGARKSERQGMIMFGQVITSENPSRIPGVCGADGAQCLEYAKEPWRRIKQSAEEAYDRSSACTFTSFTAYEYTGTPGTSNYHRNVVFRNDRVPDLPISYVDAPYDSALWDGLDATCRSEDGCTYVTIPHNTNLANGRMAPYMRLDPTLENRQAYAAKRLQREPIMEIFQHKGASECINGLGSVLGEPDELCEIEAVRVIGREETFLTTGQGANGIELGEASEVTAECGDEVGENGMLGAGCVHATDFLRSGLLIGLEQEQAIGANPVKLGVIASTDTHTASPGSVMEDDWRGHVSVEATPQERLRPGLLTSGIDGNPGRSGRRVGGRELPRRHLRGDGATRSVRHVGPTHRAALLRRLELPPGTLRFGESRRGRIRWRRPDGRRPGHAAERHGEAGLPRECPPRPGAERSAAPAAPADQGLDRWQRPASHRGDPDRRGAERRQRRHDDGPAARRRSREPVRGVPRRELRPEPARLLLPARRRESLGTLARVRLHAGPRRRASAGVQRRLRLRHDPGDGLDVPHLVSAPLNA